MLMLQPANLFDQAEALKTDKALAIIRGVLALLDKRQISYLVS